MSTIEACSSKLRKPGFEVDFDSLLPDAPDQLKAYDLVWLLHQANGFIG